METTRAAGSIVLLTRLARVVYRRSSEEVLGIKLKQLMGLAYLRDHPATTQQAFCESVHLDPNNCVLYLNDLEAAGYATRRRDPSDRRRHILELTPEGQQALEQAEHAQDAIEDEVLAGLDPEERATLRELLARALAVS
jgi:DNA-binding MarR family transcriptional regulator